MNSNQRREINDLVDQSSLLLGSIKEQIENSQEQKFANMRRVDSKYESQLTKIRLVNEELDDMVKASLAIADKFRKKDNSKQVNQNNQTGELGSHLNYSIIPRENYENKSMSIQASITQQNNHEKGQNKSRVSSVLAKIPSDNPLSNEGRLIMKHEGIQTDKKPDHFEQQEQTYVNSRNEVKRRQSFTQIPKLQLPMGVQQQNTLEKKKNSLNTTDGYAGEQHKFLNQQIQMKSALPPQSRFVNRAPSRLIQQQDQQRFYSQGNMTTMTNSSQKFNPVTLRPQLLIQDFYRHGSTNIAQIQQQANYNHTLTQNQSYQNIYNSSVLSLQQQVPPSLRIPLQQTNNKIYVVQNQPVNPYHHYRNPIMSTANFQNNMYNNDNNQQHLKGDYLNRQNSSVMNTGRFSMKSSQPIQNVDQAMAILMD